MMAKDPEIFVSEEERASIVFCATESGQIRLYLNSVAFSAAELIKYRFLQKSDAQNATDHQN
ncbi:hypothetical protein [Paenibacillus sp. sgz500958]|uniref:hypothetical protein n=1 Tax=Paenibacillus sp. sgz500958 TaxID=3242475 RepID=UPI0036D2D364